MPISATIDAELHAAFRDWSSEGKPTMKCFPIKEGVQLNLQLQISILSFEGRLAKVTDVKRRLNLNILFPFTIFSIINVSI